MKKINLLRLLPLLLALLAGLLLCCSCTPDTPPDTPDDDPNDQEQEEDVPMLDIIKDGVTQYAVVRPEDCDTALKTSATLLRRALKTISGAEDVGIKTDYEEATP